MNGKGFLKKQDDDIQNEFPELFQGDAVFAVEQVKNIPKYEESLRERLRIEALKFHGRQASIAQNTSIELGMVPDGNPNDFELHLALEFQKEYLKYLDQQNFIKKFDSYTVSIDDTSNAKKLYARIFFIPSSFLDFLKNLSLIKKFIVFEKKKRCFIKFGGGAPIDVGAMDTRRSCLITFLADTPDIPRKIDYVYDAIKKSYDGNRYPMLNSHNPLLSFNCKKNIIENARRELQRTLKQGGAPGKISLRYFTNGAAKDSVALVIV